jgi:hypothetical protein
MENFHMTIVFVGKSNVGKVLLTEKFDVLENSSKKCYTPGLMDVRNIGNLFRHPYTAVLCHPVSLTEFSPTFITVYFA